MDEKEFLMKRIRELANLSEKRGMPSFSDFLTLYEQNLVYSLHLENKGFSVISFGGYPEAERKVFSICPGIQRGDSLSREDFGICCLSVMPKSPRFAQPLSHRDYLGALIHLGVERSVIGDILVRDGSASFFCLQHMADFFLDNLNQVKHNAVVLSRVEEEEELPRPRLIAKSGTVASVRIDSLISLAFQESRSSLAPLISQGLVYVNGKLVGSAGFEPQEGDIVSVRGKGRFRYEGESGRSKKGRLCVGISLYKGSVIPNY